MNMLLITLIGITVMQSILEMLMPKGNIKKIATFVTELVLVLAFLSTATNFALKCKNINFEKWGGETIAERF